MVLFDIKNKTGPNPGGGLNLYIAPAEDVQTIPAPDAVTKSIDTDIVPKAGKVFNKFDIAPGTLKISNPSVGENGSGSFETLVDCIISGDDAKNLDLFNSMINGLFILLIDQASKNVKVGGTLRSPMMLISATFDGGADQPDRNGVTLQFKSRDGNMVSNYTGTLPLVAVP
jgi:hypothetical protein